MAFNPQKHHRSSIRLKDYDYSQPGAYFVTICTQNRECVLGRIENEKFLLAESGEIIQHVLSRLPDRFPDDGLDKFVIMPNHVHAIILLGIKENRQSAGSQFIAPKNNVPPPVGARFIAPKNFSNREITVNPPTLGHIIRAFKAVSTRLIRTNHFRKFSWQRGYYEHIIRNEKSLNAIRIYIRNNPFLWQYDSDNTGPGVSFLETIDRERVKRCGFSEEEFKFILNYDILYRMGWVQKEKRRRN